MFAKDKYKPNLFNQDSDTDDDANAGTFGTNKEFAKNFNKLRSKELLKKHKNASDSDSSSDDSDDSSDNDTINPKFDEAFYKALASIKKKDPNIYTDNVKFFDDFDAGTSETAGRTGQKAMTVVDYERKILLEKGGKYEDSDDDEANANNEDGAERPMSPTYNQEQQNLRDEFRKVIDDDEDSDNAEWGGIFKRRDKSKAEEAAEEEQYTKWLAGEEAANIGENAETLKPLKEYWANPKLAKEEAFLRDYILNNGYNKKATGQVPCYDDIVGNNADDNDGGNGRDAAADALSDDEAELEKQAEFEHKYNFRFEEPDAEFIKRYPRTIENSVRRTDDRRKDKRQEVKDRKTRDKEQKLRELEMLSAMKKREIEDKIAKLRMVTGNEELAFDDADLDGDFDPEEYDRKMQAVFNSEYYQVDEGDEKPECPAELEDLQVEDWDNYDPRQAQQDGEDDDGEEADGHCEDDDFNMDCEFDGAAAAEREKKAFQANLIESTRAGGKRKRKRKSKFMEVLQSKKPVFDPSDEKSFGDYLDEYYQLDYEDVIGDVPCRFKYTETVPNDFGLTVEEILLAKNKELNQWASLKKATQIRPEHVERNEIGLFKQKGKNEALKRKILQSLYEVPSDEEEVVEAPKSDGKTAKKADNKKPQPVSVKTADNFVLPTLPENNVSEQSEKKVVTTKSTKPEKPKSPKVNPSEKSKTPKTPTKPPVGKSTEKSDGNKPNNKRSQPNATPTTSPASKKAKLDNSAVAKNSATKDKKKQPIVQQKKPNGVHKGTKNAPPKKGGKPNAKKTAGTDANKISDERLRAFGINPKKFHNKQKYGPAAQQANKTNVAAGKKPNKDNGNIKPGNNARKAPPKRPIKKPDREALERMKAKMFATKKE